MARTLKKAFTLIELLIFLAIFSLIVAAFMTILVAILRIQTNQSALAEVNQEGQFLLQQIQYNISSARLVDMTQDVAQTSTLTLREFTSSTDPTTITLTGGTLYLQQGVSGAPQALTSNKVNVASISFTRHYNLSSNSSAFGTDSVAYTFTLSATSTNNQQYSQSFEGSEPVFAPVPKIALIQQNQTTNSAASVAAVSSTYPTNNETSSLLLAVVANTTSSASVSIADTAGNTWSMIASSAYPSYNEKMTMFDALNAKNSSNTVTATFGAGAGVASLFIYEYRGASTSSSFDASSSQLQSNTTIPSSGFASATSAIELLFSAIYNGGSANLPSVGNGFVAEASSTVSHVFTENQNQYVTGPVAASWSYGGAASSSLFIATFK